jgi:hypothetical protein
MADIHSRLDRLLFIANTLGYEPARNGVLVVEVASMPVESPV